LQRQFWPCACARRLLTPVIQATNNLSDERAEFLINDRLSFIRGLAGPGKLDRNG
jgi:hypothetical protein